MSKRKQHVPTCYAVCGWIARTRSGARTSPTCRCGVGSSTSWRSWTGTPARFCLGGYRPPLEADFCVEAPNEAIHKFGLPEIMNSDQRTQFTSFAWTNRLRRSGVRISMDGKGRFLSSGFSESQRVDCLAPQRWAAGSWNLPAVSR